MIIFCDGDGYRLVTTAHHRQGKIAYEQAVAAVVAEQGRRSLEVGDLIGHISDVQRSGPPIYSAVAPRAATGQPPPTGRPPRASVQKDRAAQAVRLCNRGLLQLQSGKAVEAINAFEEAMKLNPADSRAVMLRGVAAARQGEHLSALGYYNRALEIDPGSVEAYQSRGLTMMKLERLPEAIEDFTKAVTLNPKFEEGYVRRGLAYGRMGEYVKAVADNTAAIAINPKNPLSYNNRAAAYTAMGEAAKASADLEVSRKLETAAKK
jgi:tetratricopeptide (TPR) repeat protein